MSELKWERERKETKSWWKAEPPRFCTSGWLAWISYFAKQGRLLTMYAAFLTLYRTPVFFSPKLFCLPRSHIQTQTHIRRGKKILISHHFFRSSSRSSCCRRKWKRLFISNSCFENYFRASFKWNSFAKKYNGWMGCFSLNPTHVKNVGIAQNQAFNKFLAFHSRLKKALMKSSDDSNLQR